MLTLHTPVADSGALIADSGALIAAGGTWHFHAWFRDVPGSPCATGANLSSLYSVTFTP